MISTALDNIPTPPSSRLLGWHLLDARPKEGWIRIGFDGKRDFCNPAGFVQGGILSRDARRHHGAGGVHHDGRKTLHGDHHHDREFSGAGKAGPIIGEANVTQLGKTIAFVEGRLMAEDGTLLATATTSARLVETAKAIAPSASLQPAALPA